MKEDNYLEDFVTVAVYFCVTVAIGLSVVAGVLLWVWEK